MLVDYVEEELELLKVVEGDCVFILIFYFVTCEMPKTFPIEKFISGCTEGCTSQRYFHIDVELFFVR